MISETVRSLLSISKGYYLLALQPFCCPLKPVCGFPLYSHVPIQRGESERVSSAQQRCLPPAVVALLRYVPYAIGIQGSSKHTLDSLADLGA